MPFSLWFVQRLLKEDIGLVHGFVMERKYFDLDALADELNVDIIEMPAPGGGGTQKRYSWKHEELIKAVSAAKMAAGEGSELWLSGGAMPWLLGAVAAQLAPVLQGYKMGDTDKEVAVLPMGTPADAGEVKFSIEERGDSTYISYECDDPSKPPVTGPHNYDLDKLKYVVLPEIKPGTKLYLKSSSYFLVLIAFLKSWIDRCESVSIWDMQTNTYICGYSKDVSLIGTEVKAE